LVVGVLEGVGEVMELNMETLSEYIAFGKPVKEPFEPKEDEPEVEDDET
jgi:hypothetical protein